MPQREGHIYLTLFIVAMVLFVISTVAFFIKYNENERNKIALGAARDQNSRIEKANTRLGGELRSLQALIAGPQAESVGSTPDAITDFKTQNLTPVEEHIKTALKDLNQSQELSFSYLIEPYDKIDQIFKDYQRERDDANKGKTEASTNLSETLKTHQQSIAQRDQQIQDLNTKLAESQQQYEDCANQRTTEKEEHVRKVATLQEEITDAQIRHNREAARLNNQIQTLRSKLDKIESEKIREEEFAELDPDGRLTRVIPALHKGWIDLGRRDHLMAGLVFRVFQIVKGGRKIEKGRVEVRKVDEDYAEVRVLEETDPLANPITNGDYIASPFYDSKEKPIFVFAGKELASKDVTREFLEAKLERYGVEMSRTVDIRTTFLVALEGYQASTEYSRARELGVPVLRERDVLEFIGY